MDQISFIIGGMDQLSKMIVPQKTVIWINQGCNINNQSTMAMIIWHDSFTELVDRESTDRGRQNL